MDDLKQLKLVKNIYIVMSLLFCVLGIFLMAKPKSSVKMLCMLMGIMLILYGALRSADISQEMLFVWHFSLIWLSGSC